MNQLNWTNFGLKHEHTRPVLYCLPYAGGGANMFRSWALQAKDKIEIKALSMPGRENKFKIPAYEEYKIIFHDLIELMQQEPASTCSLFGYSLGALLAFDVVRVWEEQLNISVPKNLFLAGMSAPHMIKEPKIYAHYSDDELISDLLNDPDNLARKSPELIQLQRLLLPALRADHKLYETYKFTPLEKKLTTMGYIFAGKSDIEHKENIDHWQDLFEKPIEIKWFEGEHMFVHRHQEEVLKLMMAKIQKNN